MSVQLRALPFDQQLQMLAPGEGEELPGALQMHGGDGADHVHAAAAHGISGGGGALPYADKIQQSFGSHDISGVQAHTGSSANEATSAMGANAYATGNHVVLGSNATDLHTAAHEAAHIVQQRSGVSLQNGVGQSGDKYEQHADQVADAVVSGKSAEGLLSSMSGGGGGGGTQMKSAVQMDDPPLHGGTNREGNYEDHGNVGQETGGGRGEGGLGVSVSSENGGQVTVDQEWEIWKGGVPPIPIAAVPGLFITFTPDIKASVGGSFQGIDSGERQVQVTGQVQGSAMVGLEYGAPPAASIYLRGGPVITAAAQLTMDREGLQAVQATLSFDAQATVGVQAGDGAVDYNVVLGRANLLRFVGFSYQRGAGCTWGTAQPGQDVIDALTWAKGVYDRVSGVAADALDGIVRTGRRVASSVSSAWGWLRDRTGL